MLLRDSKERPVYTTWKDLCHKFHYQLIDTFSDYDGLLVMIPSRSRPQELDNIIAMLYSTCSSKDNFDILCLVDDDQKEMYKSVRDKYTETFWKYPPHNPKNWKNIVDEEQDFIEKNNYYFVWHIADDLCEISHGWDAKILDKKDYFKDGIFVLHQNYNRWGERTKQQKVCYIDDHAERCQRQENLDGYYARISHNIEHGHDHCAILTSRLSKLMYPIYNEGNYTIQSERITGAILAMLMSEHGENRNVMCDISYNIIDNKSSARLLETVIDGVEMTREMSYPIWSHQRRFSVVMPIVERMYSIIERSRG